MKNAITSDGRHVPLSTKAPAPVAVVTGASGGVGRATVRELAARGYDVGLVARGRAGLEAAAEEVRSSGRRYCVAPTDVSSFEEVERAASTVAAELGPVGLWVNNAMTTVFGTVAEIDPAEFRRATEVTYFGQVHGTMAALGPMRERNSGTILSVGSALAFRGIPLQAAYCGSKFAVHGFMESLRTELLHEGSDVRVTEVHLPAVNTPQFGWCRSYPENHPMPVPPIYQPEVVARAIVDAAEDLPRQTFVEPWNWFLAHLNRVMPGVGDHYMARTGFSDQLTDQRIDPDRPVDLWEPVDEGEDHGAHGVFDDLSGGMMNTHFLRSLPSTVANAALAAAERGRAVAGRRAARRRVV